MWRVMASVLVAALCGCNDECEDLRQVVAPSTGTEPGTLQSGTLQARLERRFTTPSLAARSDGSVVCVTCRGVLTLDARQRRIGGLDVDLASGAVVAPDDSIYAVVPGPSADTAQIVALSPENEVRWRTTIGQRPDLVVLVASGDGLYAGALIHTHGSNLPADPTIFAVDPSNGVLRPLASGQILGPANPGVMVLDPGAPLTVRRIDPAGNIVWSHLIHAEYGVDVTSAIGTSDGGAVVFGPGNAEVELGDRTVMLHGEQASFVAGFDATGATQWAFADNTGTVNAAALTPQGQILIATERIVGGALFQPQIDTYLSLATPAGIVRTLTIDGGGIQEIIGLAAAPDGAAWIQVEDTVAGDDDTPPRMRIGGNAFPDEGLYLFKIVP